MVGGKTEGSGSGYNTRGTKVLNIYRAVRGSDKSGNTIWARLGEDKGIVFSLENFSVANPVFSPDKDLIFFTSCAPFLDAQGQSDIYVAKIRNHEIDPKSIRNLGMEINTPGREMFPFISSDGTMFFSSDGVYNQQLGKGLLDIYEVRNIVPFAISLMGQEQEDKPKISVRPLGDPFNSNKDDFAFFFDPKIRNGEGPYAYFSTNRNGTEHGDDIHRVEYALPSSDQNDD